MELVFVRSLHAADALMGGTHSRLRQRESKWGEAGTSMVGWLAS